MNPEDIQQQLDNFKPATTVDSTTEIVNKTLPFNIGNIEIAPTYWQAALVIFLLFILILTIARLRRLYVGWSVKGFFPILILGFVLAIVFEGFMILSGKTFLITLLGWENAPKPISTALDEGRNELIKVLGVSEETAEIGKDHDFKDVIGIFEALSEEDKKKVNEFICEP
ncbi:hypothetical protein JXA63_02110 [Candidatus Woesebacteria bacterium]|nr:hypothetical protein [Candidatus Woesebacteria bacterium]